VDIKVKESCQDLEPGNEIRSRLYSMPQISEPTPAELNGDGFVVLLSPYTFIPIHYCLIL
jgi:hypothetical protein